MTGATEYGARDAIQYGRTVTHTCRTLGQRVPALDLDMLEDLHLRPEASRDWTLYVQPIGFPASADFLNPVTPPWGGEQTAPGILVCIQHGSGGAAFVQKRWLPALGLVWHVAAPVVKVWLESAAPEVVPDGQNVRIFDPTVNNSLLQSGEWTFNVGIAPGSPCETFVRESYYVEPNNNYNCPIPTNAVDVRSTCFSGGAPTTGWTWQWLTPWMYNVQTEWGNGNANYIPLPIPSPAAYIRLGNAGLADLNYVLTWRVVS